jgi:hypothetical protein
VRRRKGAALITDGPFTETKEWITGVARPALSPRHGVARRHDAARARGSAGVVVGQGVKPPGRRAFAPTALPSPEDGLLEDVDPDGAGTTIGCRTERDARS